MCSIIEDTREEEGSKIRDKRIDIGSFYLPTGSLLSEATGVQFRGFVICLTGMVLVLVLVVIGVVGHQASFSVVRAGADVAFVFVRIPRSWTSSFPEIGPSGWAWLCVTGFAILFAVSASLQLSSSARSMTGVLSARRLPDDNIGIRRLPLASAFLLCLILGLAIWLALLTSSDSIMLRLVRVVAIALICQIACMVLGGALAMSHAEGMTSKEALNGMLLLAWRQKGSFMRAAVYSLPRWLGTCVVLWCAAAGAILLPVLVGERLLHYWLVLVGSAGTLHILATVVSVLFGCFVFIVCWAIYSEQKRRLARSFVVAVGATTVWGLFVLPFMSSRSGFGEEQWLADIWHYVLGSTPTSLSSLSQIGLVGIGLFAVFVTALVLGIQLIMYPLAIGVGTYFTLRQGVSGKAHGFAARAAGDGSGSLLSGQGAIMFGSGGESALSSVSPPRGWMSLAWAGLRPAPLFTSLLIGLLAAVLFVTPQYSAPGWAWIGLLGVTFLAMAALAPIACRGIGTWLHRAPVRTSSRKPTELSRLLLGGLGVLIASVAAVAVVAALGTSLGLIPTVGPILLACVCPLMMWGAFTVLLGILNGWLLGSIMLPAIVAVDVGPSDKSREVADKVDTEATAGSWGFLVAMLAGIPFAMLPAIVVALVFAILRFAAILPSDAVFLFVGVWGIAGLGYLGLATTVTNAYMSVPHTVG